MFARGSLWGGTLRAGGAFLQKDDVDNNFFGALVNGQIFYNLVGPLNQIANDWLIGINVDYEHYELKHTKAEIEVLTLLPFMEFRTRYDHWAPYVTAGGGINLNAITNEPSGINLNAKNSLAAKVGIGVDWFITDHIAINTETAWKYNNSDLNVSAGGSKLDLGHSNLSTIQVMAGLRYYFGD